jgi:hypothetical protein
MGTLILPDWNYPLRRRPMTDAERWTTADGYHPETLYRNEDGDLLAES